MQTKTTLAKKLREPGLSYRDASVYLDILLDTIVETLSNGESIQLRGFGTFCVGKRAARNTSISGVVPEHGIVVFRPSDNLRKAVWGKGKQ